MTGKLGESWVLALHRVLFLQGTLQHVRPESEGYKPQTDSVWCRGQAFPKEENVTSD